MSDPSAPRPDAGEGGELARFSSLDEVRAAIDRLDRELVRALGQRARCVAAAAAFKSSESEVRAPARLESMMADRRRWASEEHLDPDFVEATFRAITTYFISREMRQWRDSSPPAQG